MMKVYSSLGILLAVVACATSEIKPRQDAQVIHLTSPNGGFTKNSDAQRSDEGVVVSSVTTQPPIIEVQTKDGLPPNLPAAVQLPAEAEADVHTVAQGETLYSIAKAYDKNYQALAALNKLDSNYTIFPGQQLRLDVDETVVASATKDIASTKAQSSKPQPIARKKRRKDGRSWIWPIDGKATVLNAFGDDSERTVRGIDIAGKAGDAIYATSDGIVVYAGNELAGYGNLVIISHGEKYISAYGHNQTILVKEEEKVQQGQKIANMGSSGANRVKLFFQIRRQSKPVDPIGYLPKR